MWVSQRSETEHACIVERGPAKEDGHTHLSRSRAWLNHAFPSRARRRRDSRERERTTSSRSLQRAHHPTLEQLCTDLIVEVCYSVGAVAMGGGGAKAQPNPPMAGTRVCMQGSASALPVSMAQSLTFLWQHASVRGPSGFVRKALLCS